MSSATDPQLSRRRRPASRRLALVAMLFAVAMTFIDQTIVAIATPQIQTELSLTRSGSQWVVNAYLLALAATFALGGRLADLWGARRMAVAGILLFAASSALCGATPHDRFAEAWIITFRALQGVGAALMVPAALAVVVAAFPVQERGRALAVFFGVSGGLTAIGPIAGGYLTQWTWRAIFWINIPVAVLALVLAGLARIPQTRRPGRIDVRGAVLVIAGMALSVLGFERAQAWGWTSAATWACLIGGAALLVVFAAVQARTADPLIRVAVFRDRAFVIDNVVLFLSMLVWVPVFFFASVYATVSLGYTANQVGLYLLVLFAGFAPAAQVGGRMLDRGGARRPAVLGSALATVGFALWAGRLTDLSLGAQWPYILIAGAGIGLLAGPMSTDAVNRAIGASYGEVTGITQTVRNYGSALGVAVLGTVLTSVFASQLRASLVGVGLPDEAASRIAQQAAGGAGAQSTQGAPAALAGRIATAVQHDFALGTQAVLYGMAVALALALVAAWFHPGRRPGVASGDRRAGTGGTNDPAAPLPTRGRA